MESTRFLGASIIIASAILGAAIVYHAQRSAGSHPERMQIGRYQFQPSNPPGVIWVIDTTTGEVKTR